MSSNYLIGRVLDWLRGKKSDINGDGVNELAVDIKHMSTQQHDAILVLMGIIDFVRNASFDDLIERSKHSGDKNPIKSAKNGNLISPLHAFSWFGLEMRGPVIEIDIGDTRLPKNIKEKYKDCHFVLGPGEDLLPLSKLVGKKHAVDSWMDKWSQTRWTPGIKKTIKLHAKRVHLTRAKDWGSTIDPGYDPNSDNKKFGSNLALYKITPDKKFRHRVRMTDYDVDVPHPIIKRVKGKLVTHKWDPKTGTWTKFG